MNRDGHGNTYWPHPPSPRAPPRPPSTHADAPRTSRFTAPLIAGSDTQGWMDGGGRRSRNILCASCAVLYQKMRNAAKILLYALMRGALPYGMYGSHESCNPDAIHLCTFSKRQIPQFNPTTCCWGPNSGLAAKASYETSV